MLSTSFICNKDAKTDWENLYEILPTNIKYDRFILNIFREQFEEVLNGLKMCDSYESEKIQIEELYIHFDYINPFK